MWEPAGSAADRAYLGDDIRAGSPMTPERPPSDRARSTVELARRSAEFADLIEHGMRPLPVLDSGFVGAWRSLVAHQSGGPLVVGSNPAAPTNIRARHRPSGRFHRSRRADRPTIIPTGDGRQSLAWQNCESMGFLKRLLGGGGSYRVNRRPRILADPVDIDAAERAHELELARPRAGPPGRAEPATASLRGLCLATADTGR